ATLREQFRQLLGVVAPPMFTLIARHPKALPHYTVGHLDRLFQIKHQLSFHPGLALAGNAYTGVGIPDCIHSAESAADSLLSALFPHH
ncbi:MAG: FAD-dependent oxidoreductase, partial [bacterium]